MNYCATLHSFVCNAKWESEQTQQVYYYFSFVLETCYVQLFISRDVLPFSHFKIEIKIKLHYATY